MNRPLVALVLLLVVLTASPGRGVVLQVGAFEESSNRNDRVEQLHNWGFEVQFDTSPAKLTRVRTKDLEPGRARELRIRLKEQNVGFFVVEPDPGSPEESTDRSIPREGIPWDRLEEALGAPYQWGGQSPETGFDCSGLLVWLLPHSSMPRTVQSLWTWGHPVQPERVSPGDLVFFGYESSTADHVGLVTGSDTFVHASRNEGVVQSRLDRPHYRRRILGYRLIPDPKSSVR